MNPLRRSVQAPTDLPFVDDPDETLRTHDYLVPLGVSVILVAGLLLVWGYRASIFGLRRRATPRTELVEVLEAALPDGPPIPLGLSTPWVRLRGASGQGRSLQRVMWNEALTGAPSGPFEGQVRGPRSGPRGVVVTLPDGTALVPVGRRRRRPPWYLTLGPVRPDPRHAEVDWVLPPGASRPRPRPGRTGTLLAVGAAAAAGGYGWFLIGSPLAVAAFAASGVGLLINGRALAGVRT